MLQSDFEKSARYVAARNLTANVAAVGASWNDAAKHMHVIYYLYGPATDDDEEGQELTVGELVAEFPAIMLPRPNSAGVEDLEKG